MRHAPASAVFDLERAWPLEAATPVMKEPSCWRPRQASKLPKWHPGLSSSGLSPSGHQVGAWGAFFGPVREQCQPAGGPTRAVSSAPGAPSQPELGWASVARTAAAGWSSTDEASTPSRVRPRGSGAPASAAKVGRTSRCERRAPDEPCPDTGPERGMDDPTTCNGPSAGQVFEPQTRIRRPRRRRATLSGRACGGRPPRWSSCPCRRRRPPRPSTRRGTAGWSRRRRTGRRRRHCRP